MPTESLTAASRPIPGGAAPLCIVKRPDGVYADAGAAPAALAQAVAGVFGANSYFLGLDYARLMKLMYDVGPALPGVASGEAMVRFAADIVPFEIPRRALYRAVKIQHGAAEYYFEPVFLSDPEHPDGVPAHLDADEFVADMWSKGIRCGIDIAAVRAAIDSGRSERVTAARRIEPTPGRDARIVEVAEEIHRSDAPRQLANGKLDLMAFQNRFPQIQQGARLLQKLPRTAGARGFELSGMPIEPELAEDVDLRPMAGPGTRVELHPEGEFLVAQQTGYLNVDPRTSRIEIGDKIVSRDGVSARTTGNLQLTGDYEEFGEVQEKRVIEGESITIHGDVFGNLVSRGGTILLSHNLVGGSAHNERGDIRVNGVASNAIIQTRQGDVVLHRAESCVISGTRVVIEHAANCEIMAEEVVITQAEGCAIAGRRVQIEAAAPRRQNEMVVHCLQPDRGRIDEVIAAMGERVAQFRQLVDLRKAQMDEMTGQPEVRKYMLLASKIRKKELTLTAEQLPQFQKMALAVGPALKAIAKLSLDLKAAETEQQAGEALIAQLVEQRSASEGVSRVAIAMLDGDTSLRSMKYQPDGSSQYDRPAREIKQRLRLEAAANPLIAAQASGALEWSAD